MNEKVWIVGCLWILVSSMSMTGEVKAVCTPTPDCASIGYTETSCETDYLACPFDNTKLKCMPCDSTYRYNCVGENTTKGIGDTCNDKYASCECVEGAIFENGSCVCDISCKTIGNIYYSDGSCSSCLDSAKTAVGVVAYSNDIRRFIVSLEEVSMTWSLDQKDEGGNVIISRNGVITALFDTQDLARDDFNGYENTQNIVNYYGEDATDVAAVYCYNYFPVGWENSKEQWYLPALGEIYYGYWENMEQINSTLSRLGVGQIGWSCHWSSTEQWNSSAWNIHVSTGSSACSGYRNTNNFVRCVKAI